MTETASMSTWPIVTKRRELLPEEEALPVSKYYDLDLHRPGPFQQELLDHAMPLNLEDVTPPENWLDVLQPEGYQKAEFGYAMLPDGAGYIASYTTYPGCTPKMLGWWFKWINIHPKHMPAGAGNVRYKIWNPADHWDHGFINGKDATDGIYTVETLDLGEGETAYASIRHPLDPRDFGLSDDRWQALNESGCFVDCCTESFHRVLDDGSYDLNNYLPGTHLFLTLSRINPWGILEKVTREWIGYRVADEGGKVVRDQDTPDWMLNEEYLRKVVIHGTVEAQQLSKFLPQLYAEYKDRPMDAD
ncbi:MAG: hypothetical protein ABF489_08575 [Bifidobacterium sp.]|uniref:DAPG hydrolase family protein n=1 Tax=Bifidobacterium sp. TaxID=41200 RepID=UPI0039E928BF